MKPNHLIISALTFTVFLFFSACENDDDDNEIETEISENNDDESHNHSQDCMNCHVNGGTGEGWFTVAGSVFKSDEKSPNSNGKIMLYSKANESGNLIETIEVDALGNFYTTEDIGITMGLFPVFESKNGNKKLMHSAATYGSCNNCHGVSTAIIAAD
ncbi:MAG: hypothetical protein JXQ87_15760 [Bacteroidia bacterium]